MQREVDIDPVGEKIPILIELVEQLHMAVDQ